MTAEQDSPPAQQEEPVEVVTLRAELPNAVVDVETFRGDTWIVVRPQDIVEVCRLLRDHPALQFNFFSECLGVDYLDAREDYRFEVVYNLYSLKYVRDGAEVGRGARIFLKVRVPEDDPSAPSVVSVYPGANFPEREIYDMFGIRFTGHPDLRRLLMADDWIGHPQRKDYPLGGEQVQFPAQKYGPSVGEVAVQHPGESFYGRTGDTQGEKYGHPRVPTPDKGPGTELPAARTPGDGKAES